MKNCLCACIPLLYILSIHLDERNEISFVCVCVGGVWVSVGEFIPNCSTHHIL